MQFGMMAANNKSDCSMDNNFDFLGWWKNCRCQQDTYVNSTIPFFDAKGAVALYKLWSCCLYSSQGCISRHHWSVGPGLCCILHERCHFLPRSEICSKWICCCTRLCIPFSVPFLESPFQDCCRTIAGFLPNNFPYFFSPNCPKKGIPTRSHQKYIWPLLAAGHTVE